MRKLRLKEAKWLAQSLMDSQGWAKAAVQVVSPRHHSQSTCAPFTDSSLTYSLAASRSKPGSLADLWVYFHLAFLSLFFSPLILSSTLKENISCWSTENDFKVEKEEWKDGGRREGRRKEEKKGRRKEVGPSHTARCFHMDLFNSLKKPRRQAWDPHFTDEWTET